MADLEKESVRFCSYAVQVKIFHPGPAGLGMRRMRRILRPGDNCVFIDPPTEFNGRKVIGIYGDRLTVIDAGVSKCLTLKKGPNVVRCAVVNGGGTTDFCAQFLDKDDAPIKNFIVNLARAPK
jgi:hypothetical protein